MSVLIRFTVLAFLVLSFGLHAQTLTTDVYQNPDAQLDLYQAGKTNAVYLNQVGEQNNLNLRQTGNSQADPGLARIHQEGTLNNASITLQGAGMRTDLLQNGNYNTYTAVVTGQANTNLIIQNGMSNTVEQNIQNSSGVNSEFIQNGNGNLIQQTLNNVQNQTYRLTQNGNGLRAVIVLDGN
jgi:hypothetical protein